jgi:hypothetical protein
LMTKVVPGASVWCLSGTSTGREHPINITNEMSTR